MKLLRVLLLVCFSLVCTASFAEEKRETVPYERVVSKIKFIKKGKDPIAEIYLENGEVWTIKPDRDDRDELDEIKDHVTAGTKVELNALPFDNSVYFGYTHKSKNEYLVSGDLQGLKQNIPLQPTIVSIDFISQGQGCIPFFSDDDNDSETCIIYLSDGHAFEVTDASSPSKGEDIADALDSVREWSIGDPIFVQPDIEDQESYELYNPNISYKKRKQDSRIVMDAELVK